MSKVGAACRLLVLYPRRRLPPESRSRSASFRGSLGLPTVGIRPTLGAASNHGRARIEFVARIRWAGDRCPPGSRWKDRSKEGRSVMAQTKASMLSDVVHDGRLSARWVNPLSGVSDS